MFTAWLFGRNINEHIITCSYNEMLSTNFSKSVRDRISEEKYRDDIIVYHDIFPETKIKKGSAAAGNWELEHSYSNYLSSSPNGTATGFGASKLIVDDIIKSYEESCNQAALDKHFEWFSNTMLSRLEEGGQIIIIMTRWQSQDLAGRMLDLYRRKNKKYRHINMKALQDDGTMLCPEVLSYESYMDRVDSMGEDVVSANYQQIPLDLKGVLYTHFSTYDIAPFNKFEGIYAVCDFADSGGDYLSCIIFGVYNMQAYVIDVVYTKKPMEDTEIMVSEALYRNKVNLIFIESNNGGRGFAKNIQRILKDKFHSNYTTVKWFHQSKNKESRIISNATWVMQNIFYPTNWRDRWNEYYKAMTTFQREGKNKNDDAPDSTTMVAEFVNQQNRNHYSKDIYDRGYGTKTVDFSEYYDRYRLKNVF